MSPETHHAHAGDKTSWRTFHRDQEPEGADSGPIPAADDTDEPVLLEM